MKKPRQEQYKLTLTLSKALYETLNGDTKTPSKSEIQDIVLEILAKYAKRKRRAEEKREELLNPAKAPLDELLPKGADPFTPISELTPSALNTSLSFDSIQSRKNDPGKVASYIQSFGER